MVNAMELQTQYAVNRQVISLALNLQDYLFGIDSSIIATAYILKFNKLAGCYNKDSLP